MPSSLVYHKNTSYTRTGMESHHMDWQNQPRLYKSYPEELPRIPLPPTETFSQSCLWQLQEKGEGPGKINLATLSALLELTQTFTARSRQPSGDFYYRSAASAGALYPNEIYLSANDVEELTSGVYYYDLFQKNLVRLRGKHYSSVFRDAALRSHQNDPGITFFITGIFNRSSWKYRKRAYRYVLLDAGHVLQNLFFALNALNLPFSIGYDFTDQSINHLLGLDEEKEVCLAWIGIEGPKSEHGSENSVAVEDLPPSIKAASLTAEIEIPYPQITDIHQSGRIEKQVVKKHTSFPYALGLETLSSQDIHFQNVDETVLPYPDALLLRRSRRNFVPTDLPLEKLMHLLALSDLQSQPIGQDFKAYSTTITTGFLADRVHDLESGFYLCDFNQHQFGMVETGNFQKLMAAICLEQSWLKNANLHFLFMANLEELDTAFGARGYRYAMMEAGRLGQTLYVGATALGLGCCGIGALFDHEARQLLSLNDASFLMYLVAVGSTKT